MMAERRVQHTGNQTGPLAIGDGGEVFLVRLDYLELDPATGRTKEQTFGCDTLARDATRALQFALAAFNEMQEGICYPDKKIWQLSAHVEIASDVLRDHLKDTQNE